MRGGYGSVKQATSEAARAHGNALKSVHLYSKQDVKSVCGLSAWRSYPVESIALVICVSMTSSTLERVKKTEAQ